MLTSLNLESDDGAELSDLLAEIFGLKWPQVGSTPQTVGDLVNLLRNHFADHLDLPGLCMTSIAFYRLRRAARSLFPHVEIRPSTLLVELDQGWPAQLLRRLAKTSGLRVRAEPSAITSLSCLPFMLAFVIGGSGLASADLVFGGAGAILAVVGVLMVIFDPGRRGRLITFGDLSRLAAANNYGSLAQQGGAIRDDELEALVTEIAAIIAEVSPSDVTTETALWPEGETPARAA